LTPCKDTFISQIHFDDSMTKAQNMFLVEDLTIHVKTSLCMHVVSAVTDYSRVTQAAMSMPHMILFIGKQTFFSKDGIYTWFQTKPSNIPQRKFYYWLLQIKYLL
jgi:hypothetical protein